MSHGMSQNTLIAVVEDDAEIRALVRGLLGREGFESVACTGGGDLDLVMEQRRGGFVVSDLLLAVVGGGGKFPRARRAASREPLLVALPELDALERAVAR